MSLQMNGTGCHQPHPSEVVEVDNIADSAVQGMYHQPQRFGIEMASGNSPPIIPHRVMSNSQGVFTTFPYYNVFIPMIDNFQGPINTNVTTSMDPSGVDLPVHGKLVNCVTCYSIGL